MVSDEAGKSYLEQKIDPGDHQWTPPLFITGDPEWSDYTVEVKVKPLKLRRDGRRRVPISHQPALLPVRARGRQQSAAGGASAASSQRCACTAGASWQRPTSPTTPRATTRCKVENDGPRIRAYIDGKLVLEATDAEILKGKAGDHRLQSGAFPGFRVTAPDARSRRYHGCVFASAKRN